MQSAFFRERPAFSHPCHDALRYGSRGSIAFLSTRSLHSPIYELEICPLKRPSGSVRPVSVFLTVSFGHIQYPASFDTFLALPHFVNHIFPTGIGRPHRLSSLPYIRSCNTYWKACEKENNGWTYARARTDPVKSRVTLVTSTPTGSAWAIPPTTSTTSESC